MAYDLYALRWAVSEPRSAHDNFMPAPDTRVPQEPVPLHFFVWCARSAERVVLVDAGADEACTRARGHIFERCPTEALAALGVRAGDVTDLVLTHLHWDHAGNIARFPNARIYVHEAEAAYATGHSIAHPYLRRPYDAGQVQSFVGALYEGRVTITGNEHTVAPDVTTRHVGGHTPGTQVVQVATRRGNVVLASDAVHYYANIEYGVPFPVVVHVDDYLEAPAVVHVLASSDEHVISGHDPIVSASYRSPKQ